MRSFVLLVCALSIAADAQAGSRARDPWNIWGARDRAPAVAAQLFDTAATVSSGPSLFDASMTPPFDASLTTAPAANDQTAAPARAFEYSDGYRTRAKIHKIASIATLPLFATEVVLGQSLYDNGGESKRSAHVAVGTSIIALFGVNTVTGVWNLWEARKDPNGRTKRLVHGLLMLASNAGFVATAMLAPDSEHEGGEGGSSGNRSTHRAVALTSIGLGTAGYLIMLFGK